jgi:hypothetical protein
MAQILAGEKNTTKVAITLMLAFMQNLRFGSAAEDAGLAMGRCIWRVTC